MTHFPLLGRIEVSTVVIVVVTGRVQYAVGNEILARAVAFYDSLDEVFRNVLIVGQQLLGVFGQAVSAVAERRIVVMLPMRGSRLTPSMMAFVSSPFISAYVSNSLK